MRVTPKILAKSTIERCVDIEPLYDSHEVAMQCRVSEKSLHRWARQGLIPAVKFGRLWRFRKSAIDQWINSKMAS
jgi:excisionase family DNA binding protein